MKNNPKDRPHEVGKLTLEEQLRVDAERRMAKFDRRHLPVGDYPARSSVTSESRPNPRRWFGPLAGLVGLAALAISAWFIFLSDPLDNPEQPQNWHVVVPDPQNVVTTVDRVGDALQVTLPTNTVPSFMKSLPQADRVAGRMAIGLESPLREEWAAVGRDLQAARQAILQDWIGRMPAPTPPSPTPDSELPARQSAWGIPAMSV